jgi:hypothetical protein
MWDGSLFCWDYHILWPLIYLATNIKRDTFRHFVPIAIPQSRVGAGFKPAPTGWRAVPPYVGSPISEANPGVQ